MEQDLKKLIAPAFRRLHNDIKKHKHTHYWLKGGRGSSKSSFISIEMIMGVMLDVDGKANGICFRKYGVSLEKSVYNQLKWAIDILDVWDQWKAFKSPLKLEYLPTGQEILFVGMDDPQKLKSIKPANGGYYKYSWFEEVNEADGIQEIRSIEQSVLRGGEIFISFKSFNPPANNSNWINTEVQEVRKDRLVHHSTYLDVPKDWLGKQFFLEAAHLKKTNELAYRHEYLGEMTGTGLTVFPNVEIRIITDEEIGLFDNIREGIDWGYAADPFCFVQCNYSKKLKKIFVFNEIFEYGLLNAAAMEQIAKIHSPYAEIVADSEDPKSIGEFWDAGFPICGAKKGQGSRGFGFKFLQGLEKIVIDPVRCPNVKREFTMCEFEKMRDGSVRNEYPDKNDHTIDAIRYALERDMPSALR